MQRILVAVDFSEPSRLALAEADRLANESGAYLTLLHVHQIVEMAFLDFTYVERPEEVARVTDAAEGHLREWAAALATPPQRRQLVVTTGSPTEEIIHASERYDLVVMGTHGRGRLGHFLMGSVAERVVRGAHCSVLIVKPRTVSE